MKRALVVSIGLAIALTQGGIAHAASFGAFDRSFGGDGRVTTTFVRHGRFTEDAAYGVIVQPDGKIVAAGYRNATGGQAMALVRYGPDGTLDPTFGGDGRVTTRFNGASGSALALQPDGKLVVAGDAWFASPRFVYGFALARYNTDGSLDPTFGNDGTRKVIVGDGDAFGRAIALQPDGSIVVAGWAMAGADSVFGVARFDPEGTLDPGFGTDGIVITTFGSDAGANGVAVAPDGTIVAIGTKCLDARSRSQVAVARYLPDGSPDASFDADGRTTTGFRGGGGDGRGVAIQPDGKIVVAGRPALALVRYQVDGSVDPTFGGDGKASVSVTGLDQGNALALQSDGKIVIVGGGRTYEGDAFVVARFTTDGLRDVGPLEDGYATISLGDGFQLANAVAIQPGGRIMVAGYAPGHRGDFGLARLRAI